jgi:predicted dehydrogenase
MVGHTFLFNDAVRWVKDYIDKGELGEIYYAYFQRLNLGRVRQDVDALWNLAPHDISIALYWFGEKPEQVTSHGVSFLQPGIDDVSFLSMRFPSGRFAHIHVSWLDPSKTRQAVIVGSNKMVLYDDTSPDMRIVVYDKGIDRKRLDAEMGEFSTFDQFQLVQRAGDIWIPRVGFREPLQLEAQHFVECVREGKRPLTDAQNGLDVVETLARAQAGRPVAGGAPVA